MESSEAADRLKLLGTVRERSRGLRPARGYSVFMLWSAVLIAAYVALFLFSFGGLFSVDTGEAGYTPMYLLLTPVLLFSGLAGGARERFGVRTTPSAWRWIGYGTGMAGFLVLAVLSLTSIAYPWWLNVVVPLILLVAGATGPLIALIGTKGEGSDRWEAVPLSTPVRVMTGVMGLPLGILLATSTARLAALISAVVVMVMCIVVLLCMRAPFGLTRVGHEWSPLHWCGFGASAAVGYAGALLISLGVWSTAAAIVTGILAVLIMAAVAFLPRRGH